MASLTKGVFIVAAKRTAFGAYGGSLKGMTATDLGVVAAKAALQAGGIKPEQVDTVCVANVQQTSRDAAYIARHVGLRSGIPTEVPALAVNRLCGSGFQSVITGAQEIQLGEAQVALAAGSESMSQAPYAVRGMRFGTRLGSSIELEDTLWLGLTDTLVNTPMGMTAENLAEKYSISREECDRFAVQSQARYAEANKNGVFKEEIAPITLKTKKGEVSFEMDENPKLATFEAVSKLPAVFKKNGTVNAGNASGICDGAGALVLASEDAIKKYNLTPLAQLMGYAAAGCDPKIMGIGPVPAIRKLLQATKMQLSDIDLVEVNEAFSPQTLACAKELGLDMEKLNVNGGAISLGHPLGASGSRITAHLTHELRRQNKMYAIGSACIGGGQGIALLLRKC